MDIYVVKQGDTVAQIAAEYSVPTEQIIYVNQLAPPYTLVIGQALLILTEALGGYRPPSRINGYAYPFISDWTLRQTLPYLTELSVFSYGFTSEGHLIEPALPDDFMIAQAIEFGALPILTLTPFGPDGQFNNMLIHSVVQSQDASQTLIAELAETVLDKGYGGTDIDFEYILREDRDAFTAFVKQVADAMRAIGRQTSVALAPKQSADQKGLLYEGKDYGGLAAAADYVLLMTYEWGYT